MFRDEVESAYKEIQDSICQGLSRADGKAQFAEENWQRDGGGGGRTRVIQKGAVIEKGGVNFSAVHGKLPGAIQKSFNVAHTDFFATGVSIVIHPENPFVPIIHMNIRYFEMDEQTRWFGGGIDLTPHYIIPTDARFFHYRLKQVCDEFNADFYSRFKAIADDYFFIKHRSETRGIGGIFYDRLTPTNTSLNFQELFDFSKAIGNSFLPIYTELIDRNKDTEYEKQHKEWQFLRRSRYAEFNLVYDAGTKFGLETNGRIESILMSLPPETKWIYNADSHYALDSEEGKTLQLLKKGINWI
jgi:coproporphyrinogen III oxidase